MSPPEQTRPTTGPPRLAEALLRLSMRDRNARHGLLGDLQEEYTRLARRGALPTWPRWVWYVLAVAGLSGRFLVARLPGAGGAGSRPPATGNAKGRTPMIDTLLKDLRYSVRTLRKDPAFTAVVVLSLGLGIGATSTIFSAINPVLLRPLPFAHPDRLVDIWETSAEQPDGRTVPQSTLLEWREHSTVLEQLETAVGWTVERTYPGIDGAERNDVQPVSRGLFRLLGVEPILGRHFVAEDADVGSARTSDQDSVIISYDFWQRRFGGDPDIIGQTWGNQVVVGVMPAGFQLFPWNFADAWAPLDEFNEWPGYYENVIVRLNPGVSMEQAQAELDGIARRLDQPEVSADNGWRVRVVSLHESSAMFYRRDLYLLMGAALLLLLIACSNVASLLVGRATNRHREITTRAASSRITVTHGRYPYWPIAGSQYVSMSSRSSPRVRSPSTDLALRLMTSYFSNSVLTRSYGNRAIRWYATDRSDGLPVREVAPVRRPPRLRLPHRDPPPRRRRSRKTPRRPAPERTPR